MQAGRVEPASLSISYFKKVKQLRPELSIQISVLRKMLSQAVKQVREDKAIINAMPSLPQTHPCHLPCPCVCSRQVGETSVMGFYARSMEGALAAPQALLAAQRKPDLGGEKK